MEASSRKMGEERTPQPISKSPSSSICSICPETAITKLYMQTSGEEETDDSGADIDFPRLIQNLLSEKAR
jgi:hypothetical protein